MRPDSHFLIILIVSLRSRELTNIKLMLFIIIANKNKSPNFKSNCAIQHVINDQILSNFSFNNHVHHTYCTW